MFPSVFRRAVIGSGIQRVLLATSASQSKSCAKTDSSKVMLNIDELVLSGKADEALQLASSLRKTFPDHPYPLFSIARILTDQGSSLNAFGLDATVCAVVEDFNKNFAGRPDIPAGIQIFFAKLSFMLQQNPDPVKGMEESHIYSPSSLRGL